MKNFKLLINLLGLAGVIFSSSVFAVDKCFAAVKNGSKLTWAFYFDPLKGLENAWVDTISGCPLNPSVNNPCFVKPGQSILFGLKNTTYNAGNIHFVDSYGIDKGFWYSNLGRWPNGCPKYKYGLPVELEQQGNIETIIRQDYWLN